MDPLSILGIAAAVVQFVDFGSRLLTRTWDIYQKRESASTEREELAQIADDLSTFSKAVRQRLGQSIPSESRFLDICRECDEITTEFRGVLEQIGQRRSKVVPLGRKITRFALAAKWSDARITAMKQRLETLNQRMMAAVLFSLWQVFTPGTSVITNTESSGKGPSAQSSGSSTSRAGWK